MPSISSKVFNLYLRFLGLKRNGLKNYKYPSRNPKAADPPKGLYKKFKISQVEILGRGVNTLIPKRLPPAANNYHIVFFPGGAYTNEITFVHWQGIEKIAKRTECILSVIEYPLSPESTVRDTFAMVEATFEFLVRTYKEREFIFMGDSAGGGLALAFAQYLIKQSQLPIPKKIVLISPWLDVSMSHEVPEVLDQKDLILNIEALKFAGMNYAGGTDLRDHRVSPIYGSFSGIPEIGIWIGTHEVFLPDMEGFLKKLKEEDVVYRYHEEEGMQHDYVIFPIPEGKKAIEEIYRFIFN